MSEALFGENRWLVTDEPVEFEKEPVEVGNFRRVPIILEESMEEYTTNEWKQNRKMSTWNQLDLESLGSWLTMPKNFPGSGLKDRFQLN